MIRIDLGKNELNKAPPKSVQALISKVRLPPKVRAYVQKIQFSASLLIITAAAVTLSVLMPIFADQYEKTIRAQHQDAMNTIRLKLNKASDAVARFRPYQRELQSYEEQKRVVTERLVVVRQLLESRATPVSILDTIGQSLPARTWLSNIEVMLSGETPTVSLVGQSYSNEEISDLIDNLSKSIYLSNVSLDEVTTKAVEKVDFRSFTITAKPKVSGSLSNSAPTQTPTPRAIATSPTPGQAAQTPGTTPTPATPATPASANSGATAPAATAGAGVATGK